MDKDKLENATTFLMGNGFVDEAIELEKMVKELTELKNLVQSTKPVCPHCRTEMTPCYFNGYYDTFSYWDCECEKIPDQIETHGGYC